VRLLVISQYFWPENFRINDLVTGLIERRHEVTVLTGQPNYPGGAFFPGYGWRGPRRETYAGASVIRVPLVPRGRAGRLRLTLNYLSFVVTACIGVFRLPRGRPFDAILVFEPSPITVGIPAALARRRYRAPVLFWVLDLWPESLAAVGVVRSPWLARRVDVLVRWIYRHCDLILAQSQAFVPAITRHGVPESLVRFFPNWGEAVFETPESGELPDLPPGFRILFAGNIGEAQDFPSIIEAAALLQGRTDIHWIILGDGRLAQWAREEVARRGLGGTVHFLGQHPLEKMPGFFAAADALLVSLRNEPTFALTVPGKLQSYLACSRPVLAMLGGEGARIVAESGAGFHSPPGDAAGLAAIAERLAALPPADRVRMGRKGREYFAEHFARERLFDRLDAWLVEATNAKPAEKPA
jgi:glycosyltransferase involved in cell wall biosynthesis